MKIDDLKVGMKVANYKALCGLLEEPVKGGKSKEAQLKELSRHCKYTRSGNAFLIEEIYEVPTQQRDGRQKYLYLIEPILLNYLAMRGKPSQELSWYKWFQELGLVDSRIYDDEACEDEVASWGMSSYSLFRLRNLGKNKMREILVSALKNMKKRGLINYEEHWRIITRDKVTRVATEWDVQYIKRVQQTVLEELGCESMNVLGLSPRLNREFGEKTHEIFNKGMRWRSVFKELKIEVCGDAAARYKEIDSSPLRRELNRKVCAAIKRMAYREKESQDQKMMEAWEEEALSASNFTLPLHFIWDVEILVDQLMVS